ncbi:MAG: aspartyl protease family protein [Clostridia bacterium]|nr:aspartyl protease family protein [Clostridia bacterium]
MIFLFIAIIFLLIVIVLLRGQKSSPEVKAKLNAADELFRHGRLTEAEAAYKEIREMTPDNVILLGRLGILALWNNKTEEAEKMLKSALHNIPWYQSFWPFTAELDFKLAMTYYRKNDFKKAAEQFKKAAGPIALGSFKQLKALESQAKLFEDDEAYIIEGPEESRIDFIRTDPLPVIQVSVNDNEPLYFILDTGGAELILNTQLAERIGATISGTIESEYVGGAKAKTGLGKINSVSIGDFKIRNIPINTMKTDEFSSIFDGLKIDGILGTRILSQFISTFDYSNGSLILARNRTENSKSLDTLVLEGKAKVFPINLIDMHVIITQGTVNNLGPMNFFVDTGMAGGGFLATEATIKKTGIRADWSKAVESMGGGGKVEGVDITVDCLTLGTGENTISEKNVPGMVMRKNPYIGDTVGFRIDGIVSHQFFRRYSVTFDFTRMILIIQ